MQIVHSLSLVGCLMVIAVCAITFPVLASFGFQCFNKEVTKELKEIRKDEI